MSNVSSTGEKSVNTSNYVAMETRVLKLKDLGVAGSELNLKETFVNLLFVENGGFVMLIFDKNKCA